MKQWTNLGGQVGRWLILAALVVALGALLLTIRPVGAQSSDPDAITPPAAPTALAAVAVGTQTVELSWTKPVGTIVGYEIQRSTDAGTTWVDVAANTGNDKEYYSDTHSSLAGKSVLYRVAAINSVGLGLYVTLANAVPLPRDGVQPSAPTGLKAAVSNTTAGTISLSWSTPSQGSGAITGYNVQWSRNGEHGWMDAADTGDDAVNSGFVQHAGTPGSTTLNNPGVGAGVTLYYRVAADNSAVAPERGPYSAVVSATTRPVGVPSAPTFPSDAAPATQAVVAVGPQTVELTWTAPADGPVTGYKIDRSTDAGVTWVVVSANTGNKNTYYTDTHSSLAGKAVVYRLAAINSVGMGVYSVNSSSVTLPKAGTQPGAPTGLRLVATNFTTVTLSWTAPSGTVTDYNVQCSENGEHSWSDLASGDPNCPGAPVTDTSTTTTATVPQGTTRYYRVAADNSAVAPERGPYSALVRVGGPADQPGTVTLSTQAPLVGAAVTATLADADGMTSSEVWKWQKSMDKTDWMDATGMGAATNMYTPEKADVGHYLRAMVNYNDEQRPARQATSTPTTSMVVANNQPTFADGMGTREVAENTAAGMNVGAPVMATDADADDTLVYSLGGADAMYFTINTSTGQIMVGEGTMLDYEGEKTAYMVTVTVNDGSGAPNSSASIEVTISVTDVEEGAAQRYDTDGEPGIQIGEMLTAIDDYFDAGLDITELLDVIDAYFANNG